MLEQIQLRAFIFLVCLVAFSCSSSERLENNSSADKGSDSYFILEPIELFIPGDPLINFHIAFRTGAIDDPVQKDGLNALTALMVARGGTKTISYEEITGMLYSWSASITVQSDKEMTTLIGHVHRDHLEPFYGILRDLIISPGFNESDFKRNKDFLTNAVVSTLRGNNDEELGKQALNTLMYQGHPYGVPEIGTEMGLGAITLDDVRAFYGRQYTRDNLLVGIAGGYPSGFGDRVASDIGGPNGLPDGNSDFPTLETPRTLKDIELLIVEKQSIATAISIGFPLDITRSEDDFFALLVANSYFGEHRTFNGLLMNKMRGERGLNYGDYSYIENFIQDGGSRFPVANIPRRQQFFSIWIRPVPHHNAHFALKQALYELRMLVEDGITEQDFEITREFLLNYSNLYVQTSNRRLGYMMDSHFYESNYYINEIQARLPLLTVDVVNAAINRHLQYKNLAVAVVTTNASEFRDKLLTNDLSTPRYNTQVSDQILSEDEKIISYELAINPDSLQIVPVEELFREAR